VLLRWTTPAADDLYRIVEHIQQDNPTAASEVAQTIYEGCEGLSRFPYRGPKGRIEGTHNWFSQGSRILLSIGFYIKLWKSPAYIMERRIGPEPVSAATTCMFSNP
jgi:plasmid stabilization system protein ParE